MSFEDRLRDHLHDKGEAIIPPPTPVDQVESAGKRRRVRNRVGGSVAALALIAGGATLLTNQAGEEPTDQVLAAEPAVTTTLEAAPATELGFREVDGPVLNANQSVMNLIGTESGFVALVSEWIPSDPVDLASVADRFPQEILDAFGGEIPGTIDEAMAALEPLGLIDQAYAVIESDPELSQAFFGGGTSQITVFTSSDGVDWEQSSDGAAAGFEYANDTAHHDGVYYFLTSTWDPATGAETSSVISTTDFETFTSTDLPALADDDIDYLTQYTSAYQLAVGPGGVVVAGQNWTDIDVYSLVPEEYTGYSLNWSETGVEVWQYPDHPADFPILEAEAGFALESTIAVPDTEVVIDDAPIPTEPDEFWEGELIATFTWAELGVDPAIAEAQMNGGHGGTAIWHAPLGGDFSVTEGLGDSDVFDIVDLVANDAGFLAVGNSWGADGNIARIWTSTTGTSWTVNTAASASFGNADVFSGIAQIGDRLVILGTCEGNAVAWVSTDGGTFWIMHPIEDQIGVELGNNFGLDQTAAGDLGILSVATIWPEFSEDFGFDEFIEPVTLDKDGFTLSLDLNNGLATLTGPEGVIHDGIELFEFDSGDGIDGVLISNADDDLTFLDPETGDELVTFTSEEGEAAVNAAIPSEFLEGEFEEPMGEEFYEAPDRHILFSSDGASWSNTDASELGLTGEWWAQGIAVGGDSVLLAVQQFDELDYFSADDAAFAPDVSVSPVNNSLRFFIGTPLS